MISELASVHPDAQLGDGVEVGPFSAIAADVVIGSGTKIHSNAVIMDGARIGKDCEIYPGAVVSGTPQDLKYQNEYTTTEIGDRTIIRECVTIHRGTSDKLKTVVGSDCLLMGYVHVAHDCTIGNHVILANYVGLSGHITIEDYVILEGKVGTQQFVRIGAHAFVGGGSLVRKNIPPFIKAAREPLTFAGVNSIGLRRRGFSDKTIAIIENIYRIVYVQNKNVSKALEIVEAEIESCPEKTQIIDFIRASEKGIIRGPV
jgi:UDP-N-acetylglucosamine acyltransferase